MPLILMTTKAQSDLVSWASYVLADSGSIESTHSFLARLESSLNKLSLFPYLGKPTKHSIVSLKDYRFYLVERHVIVYRVSKALDQIIIVRILHQKSLQFMSEFMDE